MNFHLGYTEVYRGQCLDHFSTVLVSSQKLLPYACTNSQSDRVMVSWRFLQLHFQNNTLLICILCWRPGFSPALIGLRRIFQLLVLQSANLLWVTPYFWGTKNATLSIPVFVLLGKYISTPKYKTSTSSFLLRSSTVLMVINVSKTLSIFV